MIAAIAWILFAEGGIEYSGRCGDDTYYVILPGFGINKAEDIAEQLSDCVETQKKGDVLGKIKNVEEDRRRHGKAAKDAIRESEKRLTTAERRRRDKRLLEKLLTRQ